MKVKYIFYSYHNLQGSQTRTRIKQGRKSFYSYHNLQGSQTENEPHKT